MPRKKSPARLATQITELAFATPQVVAHRMGRMAMASNPPSRRDRVEFSRMGTEKVAAFWQSWWGIWMSAWTLQAEMGRKLSSAWLPMMSAGLAPVHRKAVSNARRLR